MKKYTELLKTYKFENIKETSYNITLSSKIQKGNKKINPTELFGIWKDNPKTLE